VNRAGTIIAGVSSITIEPILARKSVIDVKANTITATLIISTYVTIIGAGGTTL
jgi:hypothetical protein